MKIARDKILHFCIGNMVFWNAMLVLSPVWSLILAGFVGVGIELYQKWTRSGVVEELDAIATALGGIAGIIAYTFMG